MLADNNQLGRRFAIEGKGDLIEAALGFVVDADGTLSVALEGDAAEIAYLRRGRGWRSSDGALQVTLMVPGEAPAVLRDAVDVLLAIWPEDAE